MKEIENFPGYFITEEGEVLSNRKGELKPLKLEHHSSGYSYVNLYNNEGRKHCRVHRLVAEAYIPNPENKEFVHHKNNDKSKNYKDNLEWATCSENTQQAVYDGKLVNASGFEDSQSIPCTITNVSTGEIMKFGSARIAAKELNISASTIRRQQLGITKPDYRSKYIIARNLIEFI